MPTHYEFAQMSREVYMRDILGNIGGVVPGWQKIDYVEINQNGFAAAAYQRGNEIIIAIRGTANNTTNMYTNAGLALEKFGVGNGIPNTQQNADNFISRIIQNYPNKAFFITGHSLGATLAEIGSVNAWRNHKLHLAGVTFDSPGVPSCIFKNLPIGYVPTNLFTHYQTAPNLVNTLYSHIGVMRRLYLQPINRITPSHAIACTWGSICRSLFWAVAAQTAWKGISNYLFSDEKVSVSENINELIESKSVSEAPEFIGWLAARYIAIFMGKKYGDYFARMLANSGASANVIITSMLYLLSGGIGASPGIAVNYSWLMHRHHPMDNILAAFNPATGQPNTPTRNMRSWPNFWQHNFMNMPFYQLYGFIPGLTANRGVHTIHREEEVIEAQVNKMYGYN